jgi:hypothetical protein
MDGTRTCFVIQPFDGGVYDKRFNDVFAPAIRAAGLEPYRVDQDPRASIPIDQIEDGIRRADVCFAEISTDNPNVWFELGYSIAMRKDVVLVCSDERPTRFPFDVQHRAVITYKTESPSDFGALARRITERLKAALEKQVEIGAVASLSPIKETEGLSSHEVVGLVTVAQSTDSAQDAVWAQSIRQDMGKAGYTEIAVTLALRSLTRKGMIEYRQDSDYNGNPATAYSVTDEGMRWLEDNQHKLVLRHDTTDDPPF